jgi:transposase
MKAGPDRRYTPEFRDAAVKQVIEGGRSVAAVARSLEMSNKSLANWVYRARKGQELVKRAPAQPVSELEAELSRLRQENAKLKLEKEILKNRPRGLPRPIWIETSSPLPTLRQCPDRGRLLFGGIRPRQKTWSRGSCGPSCGGTSRDPV